MIRTYGKYTRFSSHGASSSIKIDFFQPRARKKKRNTRVLRNAACADEMLRREVSSTQERDSARSNTVNLKCDYRLLARTYQKAASSLSCDSRLLPPRTLTKTTTANIIARRLCNLERSIVLVI